MKNVIKIKICGIRSLDDALAAVESGADLLGYNFYPPSPRSISPVECESIQSVLHNRGLAVTAVGVFVNAGQEEIERTLDQCGLDLAQLSGDETPDLVEALAGRAYKGIRPAGPSAAASEARRYARSGLTPALLVDANRPGLYGGSGQTCDWDLARDLAARYPLLLAGGLHAGNAAQALEQVQPWGVDVASGVESTPGRKDPRKITAFIAAVRNYSLQA